MQPGGHGITISDDCHIPVDLLRSRGTTLSVAADDFKAYLQQELIDTAGAAELMGCTRQNIQNLVSRGRIKPVMTAQEQFSVSEERIMSETRRPGSMWYNRADDW